MPKIHGTDTYPSNTPICAAALHAGKITREGGVVTIQLNPGLSNYDGSFKNGVESASLPGTKRSLVFVDESDSKEADKIQLAHIPRIDWDMKFTKSGFAYRHFEGQRFTFRCPPAPSRLRPRQVYGTDSYAFDSIICRAAVHAGKLDPERGGIVTVQLNHGTCELVGSIRNGIETQNRHGSDRSISIVENSLNE